jgi:hypothetical protein
VIDGADWLDDVAAVEVGGPFVELHDHGVVGHDLPCGRVHSFVAVVDPVRSLHCLTHGVPPVVDHDALAVHQCVDDDLGVVVVHISGEDNQSATIAARWAARRLRALEHPSVA